MVKGKEKMYKQKNARRRLKVSKLRIKSLRSRRGNFTVSIKSTAETTLSEQPLYEELKITVLIFLPFL